MITDTQVRVAHDNRSLTPREWCQDNRQWKRIDNIDHAKYQLGRPSSNKVFWNSVLELLGA